jgi:hypothetical protein
MLAEDIIKHLIKYLPRYTTLFNDTLTIQSMAIAGDTVDITFTTNHNLVDGNQIALHGVTVNATIDTIVYDDDANTAAATTLQDHDLTFGYQENVVIQESANSAVNGTFKLLSVPNRRNFTYEFTDAPPTPPFGTPILSQDIEGNPFNGIFNVIVITADTIRITVDDNPYTSVNTNNAVCSKGINISGASNIERIIDSYSSQTPIEPWLFVVLDDLTTGKSRSSPLDATQNQVNLNSWNIEQLANFSTYVFIPTADQITGRDGRDQAETLRSSLYKVLINAQFPTGLAGATPMSNVTPLQDGIAGYTNAFYIHQYQWQQVQQVTSSDIGVFTETRAFRDINMIRLNDFGEEIMNDDIDLDEEPLS